MILTGLMNMSASGRLIFEQRRPTLTSDLLARNVPAVARRHRQRLIGSDIRNWRDRRT